MSTRRSPSARRALLWGLAAVAILHLAFAAALDLFFPVFYDAEFHRRLDLLRARQAECADRPLALLLGSSRTVGSFRPEILAPRYASGGREVLFFNCSHIGGDAVSILMNYRRLRRAGIRPDYVAIEVLPTGLTAPRAFSAMESMTLGDYPTLCEYCNPWDLGWRYFRPRVNSWNNRRTELIHAVAPCLADPNSESNWDNQPLDRLGGRLPGSGLQASMAPELIRSKTDVLRAAYGPRLAEFAMTDGQVRAFDAVLRDVRADGVSAVLVLTPESSEFRSWYSPAAERKLAEFLEEAHVRHAVPVINARDWLPDEEFIDGHHVLLPGAERFTRLLAERVLEPLVRGRLTNATAAR